MDWVVGAHFLAHDDRAEAIVFAQLLLPRPELFDLVLSIEDHVIDRILSNDIEEREVNRVGAFAKDRALTTALAARLEESRRVLEMGAINGARKRLVRRESFAVAGVDVRDFSLRNGHQRHAVNSILE